MRADRLLSLMLLLRSRGRMSAAELAGELEVSTRTVLRDVEALSAAGVPVYAERGRAGGFALLPGYTTDLTGLTPDEALALLAAGSRANAEVLGLGPALASAMRKVLAAMPDAHRAPATLAAQRVATRQAGFRSGPKPGVAPSGGPRPGDRPSDDARRGDSLDAVREAVFAGRRLRIRYTARNEGGPGSWRTVDPIGLVDAAGRWYLLATRDGVDRTYLVARIGELEVLDEPADRPSDVDLERLWEQRRAEFRASRPVWPATVLVRSGRRAEVTDTAVRLRAQAPAAPGWLRLEIDYEGLEHATTVLWRAGPDAEALAPAQLRQELAVRAAAMAARYPATAPR